MSDMREKLKTGLPKEPTPAELALIDLLNSLASGLGDHFRQEPRDTASILPIAGNEAAGVPGGSLDIYMAPEGEVTEFGDPVDQDAVTFIDVTLELRDRGVEEATEAVTARFPCDRDYRLSSEDDEALLAILESAKQRGARHIDIPEAF